MNVRGEHTARSRRVAIVGAGISGLTAAYELTRLGREVRVFEASPRAGGLIRTEHVGGFLIEAGPDAILNAKPAALELIQELGLTSEIIGMRAGARAFVLKGRTLHALPQPSFLGLPITSEALDAYDLLSPEGRARLAQEPQIPPRTDTSDESVAGFFGRRFGPETVDAIAQPLLGGIHAGDVEQLSMRSLFPRLLDLERAHGHVLPRAGGVTSVRLTASVHAEGTPSPAETRGFASLRGGMQTLVRALEGRLPEGTLVRDSPVTSLAVLDAERIILAVPAHVVSRLVREVDRDASALCASIPYVSTASVALAWPRDRVPHPLDGTGFVVSRRLSGVRITACTWVSSKWPFRAPEDCALLRAFIGGAHDPHVTDLPDDELVEIVRANLEQVLGVTALPSLSRVYRWPRAVAQHLVGHLDRVGEIERRLEPHGVFVTGSGFRAVGIPDCVADGRRVATLAGANGAPGAGGC